MAASLPAALKSADISRFALRAAQLERAKPIMSYWCNYWIVNQILSKGLHNADQDALTFTTTLMDKLEQFKSQHADEPAVTDDIAGKAYVEQFGVDIFSKADNAVRANKASRQTGDTFLASATFLDLLQIWGTLEPEIAAKVRFAKYHGIRIAKAVKAGEDPNLSNPAPEPTADEALPPLDPNDADVQMLDATSNSRQPSVTEVPDETDRIQQNLARTSSLDQSLHPSRDPSIPPPSDQLARQPSVTEVPDETDRMQRNLARQSSINESLHPSRAPSLPRPPPNDVSPLQDPSSFYTDQNGKPEISPLNTPGERAPSIGGNYFPRVPSPTAISAPQPPPPTEILPSGSSVQSPDRLLPSAPQEPSIPPPPTSFTQPQPQHHAPPPPAPSRHHGHFLPQPSSPSHPPSIPPNFTPQSAPRQQQPIAPPQLRQSHGPIPPVPSARGSIASVSSLQSTSYPPTQATAPAPIAPAPMQPTQSIAVPIEVDEQNMMSAQKHARWAISALNFEDVPTAIRELRAALSDLGG